jgi:hypothetical protein
VPPRRLTSADNGEELFTLAVSGAKRSAGRKAYARTFAVFNHLRACDPFLLSTPCEAANKVRKMAAEALCLAWKERLSQRESARPVPPGAPIRSARSAPAGSMRSGGEAGRKMGEEGESRKRKGRGGEEGESAAGPLRPGSAERPVSAGSGGASLGRMVDDDSKPWTVRHMHRCCSVECVHI